METTTEFYVIFIPAIGDRDVYGPFKKHSDAKSWMAQEFDDAIAIAKQVRNTENVHCNWNLKNLGSCELEGIGRWEIVKNSD